VVIGFACGPACACGFSWASRVTGTAIHAATTKHSLLFTRHPPAELGSTSFSQLERYMARELRHNHHHTRNMRLHAYNQRDEACKCQRSDHRFQGHSGLPFKHPQLLIRVKVKNVSHLSPNPQSCDGTSTMARSPSLRYDRQAQAVVAPFRLVFSLSSLLGRRIRLGMELFAFRRSDQGSLFRLNPYRG